MEIKGERIIPAKRPVVWAALNDPGVLQRSIPGCETIEKVSDTELNATLTLKVGPVKAKFKGNVKLVDLMPPQQYTIVGEGQGGVAGFGKMKATVTLAEVDGGTQLNYLADAQVGGKLAQVGSRLIEGTATKLAQEFFDAFEKNVVPTAGATGGEEILPPAEASTSVSGEPGTTDAARPATEAAPAPVVPAASQDPVAAVPKWAWAVGGAVALVVAIILTNMRG
ncbi:MAG: carbon monoxide dehydrogenase subunit G [Burkholderiales bacterium]|nr:carbon monoxide dehydrogenase subunit G [Burkholderiales bacterium]